MKSFTPDRDGVVSIGVANGKIAVYLDEDGANNLIAAFGGEDGLSKDIARAILAAYPDDEEGAR